MSEIVLTLLAKDQAALASVRTLPYLRIADYGGLLWLRGIAANEAMDTRLKQLPVIQTYTADEAHNLFMPGAQTPTLNIKDLTWKPVGQYITVEFPTSALPARVIQTVPVRLVPAEEERQHTALLTTFAHWKAYADTAPAARLAALRFAVSQAGDVLIMGAPLPPMPGSSYWMRGQILLPAGMDFEFPLTAELMTRRHAQQHTLIVLQPDGQWHRLPADAFTQASRSAIRLTEKNITHGL